MRRALLALALTILAGCTGQGIKQDAEVAAGKTEQALERAGRAIDRAGRATGQALERAGQAIERKFEK